jgi:hypothetical protein
VVGQKVSDEAASHEEQPLSWHVTATITFGSSTVSVHEIDR